MNNLPLQPLKWVDRTTVDYIDHRAQGAGVLYRVCHFADKFRVYWVDSMGGSDGNKEFDSLDELKHWVNTDHYPHKMQPYVLPDSITDITNWFKAAKPEPTIDDVCTQIGCHYEEIAEMATPLMDYGVRNTVEAVADRYKNNSVSFNTVVEYLNNSNKIELLDALCDQIVTATGVAYMMGFDIEGALKEVIRSNNSKMVKGKFEYDENGKIMKPESYSEPDLTPFVKQGE